MVWNKDEAINIDELEYLKKQKGLSLVKGRKDKDGLDIEEDLVKEIGTDRWEEESDAKQRREW